MKVAAILACFLAAWDCAEKAVAAQPQQLFATDHLWLWWIVTAYWAITTLCLFGVRFEIS